MIEKTPRETMGTIYVENFTDDPGDANWALVLLELLDPENMHNSDTSSAQAFDSLLLSRKESIVSELIIAGYIVHQDGQLALLDRGYALLGVMRGNTRSEPESRAPGEWTIW